MTKRDRVETPGPGGYGAFQGQFVDLDRREAILLDAKGRVVGLEIEGPGRRPVVGADIAEGAADGGLARAPGQRRGLDLDHALTLEIFEMEIALVDLHGVLGIPRRRDVPFRQFEVGFAGEEFSRGRKLEAGLAGDRQVERLEHGHAGEGLGEAGRHQILDQRRDAQAPPLGALLGAEVELPIALGRSEIGLADEDAPLILMLEIDGEVRHLPQRLDAVLAQDDLGILDAEPGQVGAVAAAGALEHLGDGAGDVELRAGAGTLCGRRFRCHGLGHHAFAGDGLRRLWRGNLARRGGPRHDGLGSLVARWTIEAHGEAVVGGIDEQLRADEVDASRREAAGDERRAAHADGRKRRLRHDGAIGVDQADVAQPEQHPGAVGGALQNGVVDVHVEV